MTTHGEAVGEEKIGKPGGAALQCIVVTPERTWLDEVVDSVVLPASTARSASFTATRR